VEAGDIKIDLGDVQETAVLPLLARAVEAEKENAILSDTFARDIVTRVGYDFAKLRAVLKDEMHQVSFAVRALNFDSAITGFLKCNGDATVVNIGSGLDTTFRRIDNGTLRWVNLDLPDVIALRRQIIPDSEREMTIAKSVFDFTWMDDMADCRKDSPILFMAAGVLCYFEPSAVRTLFRRLAGAYPSAHVVFDSFAWFTTVAWNIGVKMGKAHVSAPMRWHLQKASRLRKWIASIEVIEEYPMFAKVEVRDDWTRKTIRGMRVVDFLHLYNMMHVRL
jgi:O-methyltransferase involved in polyketide biosynthesis